MFRRLVCVCLVILVPQFAQAESKATREPVAVAYFSSIDSVLSDLDYIVTTGGRPELAQMIQGFITNLNNLEGIDRKQPIGLYAFVPLDISGGQKDPDIVGFIPFTSVEALQKTAHLSNVLSLESTGTTDRYEFKTPEQTLAVKIQQGIAYITPKAALLDTPLPAPQPLTSSLMGQYDVVIQVRREGVPKFLWDLVMFGAVGEMDKQIQKLKGNDSAEKQLELKVVQLARASTIATMSEVRSAWLGLNISKEDRSAQLDLKLQFADSGKVAKTLQSLVESPSPLGSPSTADAAGSAHLRFQIPSDISQLAASGIQVARERNDPLEKVPETHRQSVANILDAVTHMVQKGQGDLLLQFTGEPQTGMTLVAGIHVAEGQKLSESLQQLLPEVRRSDKVTNVTLEAGTARGVKFARIEGQEAGSKEKLFYGGQPSLYVGIEADTVWLLVGDNDALQDFESLTASTSSNREANHNLAEVKLHLSDWLGLLGQAKDTKTRNFTEAARAAITDPDRDAISFTIHPESDGLKASLRFDEAYLRLIGGAIGKNE